MYGGLDARGIQHHNSYQRTTTVASTSNNKQEARLQRRLRKRQAKEQQRLSRESRKQNQQASQQPQPNANQQPIAAKTPGQQNLITAINISPQVIVVGPAGTGKSYIPAAMAADFLAAKEIDAIILTRPAVSVGRTMGYLPGDQDQKMLPWMIPLLEPLRDRLGSGFVDYCIKSKRIEIAPLETIRGRTFKRAFVIVDEAQNLTLHELKALVTRMGEDSKLVIDGDTNQTDLANHSGLRHLVNIARKYPIDCSIVELSLDDVVRSGITKQWLTAFYREDIQ